jgi:hypothetical protein
LETLARGIPHGAAGTFHAIAEEKKSKISASGGIGHAWPIPEGDAMAAQIQPRPNPNEKLVKVFDSEVESEAMVVKGLLDSAGIDNDLTAGSMVQDMFPGLGGMIILVRGEDAETARRVIADYQRATPDDDDETAEIEISEEPPEKA